MWNPHCGSFQFAEKATKFPEIWESTFAILYVTTTAGQITIYWFILDRYENLDVISVQSNSVCLSITAFYVPGIIFLPFCFGSHKKSIDRRGPVGHDSIYRKMSLLDL